jgi:uncharacterized membrane protein YbhN (UPF0104 family)
LRSYRRRAALSIVGSIVVAVALGIVLSGRRQQFTTAIHSAPLLTLLLVAALQTFALLARSEAWHVCVRAAGGTVTRRILFRAAGVGYLASVLNGSLGLAARIACLRRVAPSSSPRVPALLLAEVPIIAVEITLAGVFSFTLISPLGLPWWVPLIAIAATVAILVTLKRVSERNQTGFWGGLGVMRHGRHRMILFVLLAVCAQIARNWLALHALGVNVSITDATALLIAMFTIGQLPIGPSLGAAATVVVLGAHGIAATAAAGVILTATGIVGSLSYAGWAIADRAVAGRQRADLEPAPAQA